MTIPENDPLDRLVAELRGRRVVALTGAGVSTESGIPDYRSPESAARARRPIHGPDFVRSAELRQRYWARAMAGWERFRQAAPGRAHLALAEMEATGAITGLITQNVDRLHRAAGSRLVIELHGALAEVVCFDCQRIEARDELQERLRVLNPTWVDGPIPMAPDGDADLADELVATFHVAACVACAGALKPRVVFFGDSVPRALVDQAFSWVDDADVLLVAGTSLAVFSGYRFLRHARDRGLPIVIVNRGPVRGEEHAVHKVETSTGEALEEIAIRLRRA